MIMYVIPEETFIGVISTPDRKSQDILEPIILRIKKLLTKIINKDIKLQIVHLLGFILSHINHYQKDLTVIQDEILWTFIEILKSKSIDSEINSNIIDSLGQLLRNIEEQKSDIIYKKIVLRLDKLSDILPEVKEQIDGILPPVLKILVAKKYDVYISSSNSVVPELKKNRDLQMIYRVFNPSRNKIPQVYNQKTLE